MVQLNTIIDANTALVQRRPLVAVFFGGTSGIGHYTLRALATAESNGGKGFRAYVVGRKVTAAEEIIAGCRTIYPKGQITFIKADDISLMKDVDRVCKQIMDLEQKENEDPRIDYLMLSQGGSIFLPRKDTKEGLDVTMSLLYYSRMRTITQLLPLLLKSSLPAKVVSVYAGGFEARLIPEDLSLRAPGHYSYSQARSHMVYMHKWFMESIAEQNLGKLSLIHIFPGLVLGPGFQNPDLPAWFKVIFNWMVVPLFGSLISIKPHESGKRMLSLASLDYLPGRNDDSDNERKPITQMTDSLRGGVYSLTWSGESNIKTKPYKHIDQDLMRKKTWEHTTNAFNIIEAGGVFKD